MIIEIHIEDMAVKRLPWEEIKELVAKEFEEKEITTLRVIKEARRQFGLEVGDDGESSQNETNQSQ